MKSAYRILPLVLLFTGCATMELPEKSRDELPSSELFQGANVILIQTDDDQEAAREKVTQLLRLQDYEITQRSRDTRTIATEPRTFGSGTPGSARYFFELPEEAGDPIRVYGEYIPQQASDSNSFQQFQASRVQPIGDRRSTAWLSWLEMDELVSSYRGATVLYDRQ